MTFQGFNEPTQNWSKLPHQLIEALPQIETLAELKVILYVLRHTWGYHDDEKRISIDGFANGRKHTKRYCDKHPDKPKRIDNGVGMSANAIRDGIKRAIDHGFLDVYIDDSDKARIKKWYSLSEVQPLNPRPSEVEPLDSEIEDRTKKETIERKKRKTSANAENFSSFTKEQMSVEIKEGKFGCWNCGEPLTLDDIPESICHCGAPIYVYKEKSFGKKEWVSQPQEQGKAVQGSGDFRRRPVDAFMILVNTSSISEKKRSQWAAKIYEVASQRNATPEQAYEAIKAIKDSEYSWMTFRAPYQDSFKDVFDTMLARVISGQDIHPSDEEWAIND